VSSQITIIKNIIRSKALQRRKALSKMAIYRRSKLIQNRVIDSFEFKSAKTIGAYFATGSEVRTEHIIISALHNHKVLLLPKTHADCIVFHRVFEADFDKNQLIRGRFGITEPTGSSDIVNNIDLLIVPGLAFDSNGYRLGYGKGYYDRFIQKNKCCFTVGLAFQFQLLDIDLPHSSYDQKLSAVATEKRMLVFRRLNTS
jgi:5-formyltetrahydrofolate cyclo-ligase